MKKIFILILIISEFIISANAQMCLDIASPLKHLGSVGAKDVINDSEGKPCAKIMFEMSIEHITFSCPNIVGKPVKKVGRIECFVSSPKQQGTEIVLTHPSYGSVQIPLWCEDQPLIPREAYHIKIIASLLESYHRKFAEDEEHRKEIPETLGLNTEKVYNMSEMFSLCSSLKSLDLSSFNTSKVTNMSRMFNMCSQLTYLDLKTFNTSNVTNMSGMFFGCRDLKSLNLSSFNTSNVTDMSKMFYMCFFMTTLNITNFNTQNVTDMSEMFHRCPALTSLDLSSFNTSNVTNMSSMFQECSELTFVDLSNFDMSKVKEMNGMFYDCNKLKKIKVTNCNPQTIAKLQEALRGMQVEFVK